MQRSELQKDLVPNLPFTGNLGSCRDAGGIEYKSKENSLVQRELVRLHLEEGVQ